MQEPRKRTSDRSIENESREISFDGNRYRGDTRKVADSSKRSGDGHFADGADRSDPRTGGMEEKESDMTDADMIIAGRKFNKVVLVTHLNIFLYATCFWIQTNTLPYLSRKLAVDVVVFGYLQTVFAVVQLMGGPLFGRFGDIFGGRAAMTLAFMAAALSYLLLGLASSVPILFLSRLPSVFMHAMQGGQMIVTDLGDARQRADALGKLGMSYGVGMVVGPLVGGQVNKYFGEQVAAFVACAGSLLSVALVLLVVPAQTKRPHAQLDAQKENVFSLKKFMVLLAAPGAMFLILVKLGTGIPIGIFQSMFQVVALDKFQLAPDQNGLLMAYIGITTMVVQGVGVGVLIKKYQEADILKWSAFLLIWSYLALSLVGSIWQLVLVCLPLVIGLTTKNVVISSAMTHCVSEADTGAMLGLNMAVNSLVRSVAPTIGGYMLQQFGFPSFGVLGCGLSALVTVVLFWKFRGGRSE